VQLVIDGVRHELEPKVCGVLHDEIERRGYRLVDVPAGKDRQRKEVLPEGDLTLCTPKLDAVLRFFSPPAAALIFDTRRKLRSDPRLAGAVLESRLNDRGIQLVHRQALLTGEDGLEDPNDPRDAVVRREVVQGVARVLATELAELKPDNVLIATTGGLPAANAVIEELVRLHAVGSYSVQVLKVPDGAFAQQNDRAVPEKFHPAAGFRARWQALSLIEGGNLLGAWGAVSHLVDEPGQEWTNVVDWLRHFASSLPMPEGCDISVLMHPRMAVRTALRVELALRAGDIPRAIHGTVAFFEAALWDGLYERVEGSNDPKRRRYFRIKRGEAPSDDKLLRRGDGSKEDGSRPFQIMDAIDGVTWYWIHDGGGGPGARLAKRFLRRADLVAYEHALTKEIRDLRNDVAHCEPSEALMGDARAQMRAAGLWSDDDEFLSQTLVQSVLCASGEAAPERLLDNLLADLRRRLLSLDCARAAP
jgi:hypothetical protein